MENLGKKGEILSVLKINNRHEKAHPNTKQETNLFLRMALMLSTKLLSKQRSLATIVTATYLVSLCINCNIN